VLSKVAHCWQEAVDMAADMTGRIRPTARQRARAEITGEIKDEARRQLATTGAQLSLRAVARELGMVSSALYRYFPSRDDLLTALIIDAYDALATAAQAADVVAAARPGASARDRWRACCHAIRGWALAHPHEYALIYGSPVPGYQAPQDTIAHAARVAGVLGGLLQGAGHAGTRRRPASGPDGQRPDGQRLPGGLAAQGELVAAAVAPGVAADVAARGLIAWTQLFGMLSFELFGQLVGTADPADDFFSYAIDQTATLVGLPEA
jgi:AcrR family transcriptional regulator